MPVHTRDFKIERGEIWERLIVIKDKRTRRLRVPTAAAATVLIGTTKYVIPTTITSEGAVLLSLSPNQTEWLTDGVYLWDLAATVSRSALLTSTPLTQTIAVNGSLTVWTYANLTPLASDGVPEALIAVI